MCKALDEDTKECSCTDILARIFPVNSVFVNMFMAIADAGTIFQILIIGDMNEKMLWRRSFFETSKTTQNGKYKCSYFSKCGLTGAVLYCIKILDHMYFINKETSLCFSPVTQIQHPCKGQHLILLHIGSYGGFFRGFTFCHPLQNTAPNTDDGVTFLVLAGDEPMFHTLQ